MKEQGIYQEILKIAERQRQDLAKAEKLLETQRKELDVEACFLLTAPVSKSDSISDKKSLNQYVKLLEVEKSYYDAFHKQLVAKIDQLFDSANHPERKEFWKSAFPKLLENQRIRLLINEAKQAACEAMIAIHQLIIDHGDMAYFIEEECIFEDSAIQQQFELLNTEVEKHLEHQENLGQTQRFG